MKPAPFDYVQARSLREAVDLVAQYGPDARLLAGGQSLIAMLNMRLVTPRILIDISEMSASAYIRTSDDHITIGCATRQSEVERWPELKRYAPLLLLVLPWIGHIQTRSRGTICGSIAHADPSSELPLCLVLLNGQVDLVSAERTRTIDGAAFYDGVLQTARRSGEVISQVRFPLLPPSYGVAFNELGQRRGDFAIVAVAAIATSDTIRLAVAGASDRPETCELGVMSGKDLDDSLNAFAWSLNCQDDLHATARYRRQLIRALGRKTIEEALACRS
ncbi:MAG: FAD binding domain-containing protein [Hyphomicrobiaceae bacterium]